jgi:RHS repeat-associated protein
VNKAVWRWDSDPFGTSLDNSKPTENPQIITGTATVQQAGTFRQNLRFPGQLADGESAKYYNYFRDYDSSIGRYSTSDPIGLRGGLSTYGYVLQSPYKYSDKFGLSADAKPPLCRDGRDCFPPMCPSPRGPVPCPAPDHPKDPKNQPGYWDDLCDSQPAFLQWACKKCADVACGYSVAWPICCAMKKDKCIGDANLDEVKSAKCLVEYAMCTGRATGKQGFGKDL